jgi:hypothetical protein
MFCAQCSFRIPHMAHNNLSSERAAYTLCREQAARPRCRQQVLPGWYKTTELTNSIKAEIFLRILISSKFRFEILSEIKQEHTNRTRNELRGPFAKFLDSPYYSEFELCGGAVTVFFRRILLGKRCTFYNALPTSRKRAADRWSLGNFLPRSSLFIVGKVQKSHGARSGLYGGCSNGVPSIHVFQAEHRIQCRSRPMRFLGFSNHEKVAPRQDISKWSTVCSTFSRSG